MIGFFPANVCSFTILKSRGDDFHELCNYLICKYRKKLEILTTLLYLQMFNWRCNINSETELMK